MKNTIHVQFEFSLLAYELLHNTLEVSWTTLTTMMCSRNTYCPSPTSHASIAYRKQLSLQRTVGTIGSVWLESTPSKETTGSNTQSERYENEQSEMPNGALAAFA